MVSPVGKYYERGFFVTDYTVTKYWLKPNAKQIYLGQKANGEEIWVNVTNKKAHEKTSKSSDKTEGQWALVHFTYSNKTGESTTKNKYININDLVKKTGISEDIVSRFKYDISTFLAICKFYYSNQTTIEDAGIKDINSFLELIPEDASDLLNKLSDPKTDISELIGNLAQRSDISIEERDPAQELAALGFYESHENAISNAGMSKDVFINIIKHQTAITIDILKKEEASKDIDSFHLLLSKLAILSFFHKIKRIDLVSTDLNYHELLKVDFGSDPKAIRENLEDLRNIHSNLNKALQDERFNALISDYHINHKDLITYFLYHPNEIKNFAIYLEKLSGLVNKPMNKDKAKILQGIRYWVDNAASFKGLYNFYSEYCSGNKDKGTWSGFPEFLEVMEAADMTYKKLHAVPNTFFINVKEDFALFDKVIKKITGFSMYLRYIEYFSDLTKLDEEALKAFSAIGIDDPTKYSNFRELVKGNINDEDKIYKIFEIIKLNWVRLEIKKYQNIGLIFDKTVVDLRWIVNKRNPQERIQVKDKDSAMTPEHFVRIMTIGRNEIEKGNTTTIIRLFKDNLLQIRTVVVDPETGDISILSKGKGAKKKRAEGGSKSVTERFVVSKYNIVKVYSDIVIRPKDRQKFEDWEKETLGEVEMFAKYDKRAAMFGGHFYWGSKGYTYSAGQINFSHPELSFANLENFPVKTRIGLSYGSFHKVDILHKNGLIHADLKPENANVQTLDDGTLSGSIHDFGHTKKIGTRTSLGTYQFYSPAYAKEFFDRGEFTLSTSGDLWAWGLTLCELLSGEFPSFYEDATNKANTKGEHEVAFAFLRYIKDTKNRAVEESIDKFQFKKGLNDTLNDAEEIKIRALLKILLAVVPNETEEQAKAREAEANKLYNDILGLK